MSPPDPSRAVRRALLRHYDRHRRDLPWRRTSDPYAVWVSEIMLQQTRVDTVLAYYDRFLQRFPDTRSLAAAEEDAVMSAWSGLGYYRRARLLHRGVREVVARYGGEVPRDPEARLGLPGIGRYTAGAIGSIAFGLPEALVDGNVARVLCRLHGIDTPIGRADTERRLWAEAEALVPGARPGDLNQALMELGATVCSKAKPDCDGCPLRAHCVAHAEGRTDTLPVPRARRAPTEVSMVALLARPAASEAGAAVWLRRGRSGIFAGLWNLPMAEGEGRQAARALMRQAGVAGRLGAEALGPLEHVLTHRRLRVEVWPVRGATALARVPDGAGVARPVPQEQLGQLGISALTQRALAL